MKKPARGLCFVFISQQNMLYHCRLLKFATTSFPYLCGLSKLLGLMKRKLLQFICFAFSTSWGNLLRFQIFGLTQLSKLFIGDEEGLLVTSQVEASYKVATVKYVFNIYIQLVVVKLLGYLMLAVKLISHWKRVFKFTFYEHLAPQVLFIPGTEQNVP